MKKLVTFAIILCIVAGGGLVYLRLAEDHTAPEISYSDTIIYSDGMTEEELLEGVIAIDDEDGDVSNTLTVERVVTNSDEARATVIYVAKDSHNNIAKVTRVIDYDMEEETEPETEEETEPETVKASVVPDEVDTEAETTDTDTDTDINIDTTDMAAQSSGSETQVQTESEEELAEGAPRITLKQTRVTIQIGDSFEPTDYVDSITDDYDNKYTLWRRIQVEGSYNISIAGIYQLVYYVTDTSGNTSNRETLLLIVKDEDEE